jgi:protocatechuate 3,4-dioxygenase beta subunit
MDRAHAAEAMELYTATLQPDWSFTVEDVTRPALIENGGGWENWIIKAVLHDGVDVTHVPLSTADDLQVLVTHQSAISGTVVDTDGAIVSDAQVVVFAADEEQRRTEPAHAARTSNQGTYVIASLLPGRYLAVAIANDGRGVDPPDRETLARLAAKATPFTIAEGEPGFPTIPLTLQADPP